MYFKICLKKFIVYFTNGEIVIYLRFRKAAKFSLEVLLYVVIEKSPIA